MTVYSTSILSVRMLIASGVVRGPSAICSLHDPFGLDNRRWRPLTRFTGRPSCQRSSWVMPMRGAPGTMSARNTSSMPSTRVSHAPAAQCSTGPCAATKAAALCNLEAASLPCFVPLAAGSRPIHLLMWSWSATQAAVGA